MPADASEADPRDTVPEAWQHLDVRRLTRTLRERDLQPSDLDHGSWRTLVELLTLRVQSAGDQGLTLDEWDACGAVHVATLTAAVGSGAYPPIEGVVRRLWLTARVLDVTRAPCAGAPLRDPVAAVDLALGELPGDVGAAARDAARWRDLPREQALRLRHMKVVLRPALGIAADWGDHRLDAWVAVFPTLP